MPPTGRADLEPLAALTWTGRAEMESAAPTWRREFGAGRRGRAGPSRKGCTSLGPGPSGGRIGPRRRQEGHGPDRGLAWNSRPGPPAESAATVTRPGFKFVTAPAFRSESHALARGRVIIGTPGTERPRVLCPRSHMRKTRARALVPVLAAPRGPYSSPNRRPLRERARRNRPASAPGPTDTVCDRPWLAWAA